MVNYTHIMPTRYSLEGVDLKGVVTSDCVDNSTKKVEANKAAKELLEAKFKDGKSRCGGAGGASEPASSRAEPAAWAVLSAWDGCCGSSWRRRLCCTALHCMLKSHGSDSANMACFVPPCPAAGGSSPSCGSEPWCGVTCNVAL